MTRIVVE